MRPGHRWDGEHGLSWARAGRWDGTGPSEDAGLRERGKALCPARRGLGALGREGPMGAGSSGSALKTGFREQGSGDWLQRVEFWALGQRALS